MNNWEAHVQHEITDAVDDGFRLLQITLALTDFKEIDLIPNDVYFNLTDLIKKVGDKE
jgi:hypothetical protein